jgi:hypothetical protein
VAIASRSNYFFLPFAAVFFAAGFFAAFFVAMSDSPPFQYLMMTATWDIPESGPLRKMFMLAVALASA